MADYIDKKELQKELNDWYDYHYPTASGETDKLHMDINKIVRNMPSVDAVEVVKCKDCKWYQSVYGTCSKFSFKNGDNYNEYCAVVEKDGFCKWGEKE